MKKICFALLAFLVFSSHDMFLKMDTYFLQPNTPSSIQLFNGTFHLSENTIARNRMTDVSLVGNGNRIQVDSTQWSEVDSVTILNFTSGNEGTWVAGVSTRPRNIELAAEAFNRYLEHDGVLDMLEWRKTNNALDKDAVEKYSKHVKAIFQVGSAKTDDWQTILGYPIEFVPLSNPYKQHAGHELEFQLLWQGKPLANQLVYVGSNKDESDHHQQSSEPQDRGIEAHEHTHKHKDGTEHSHSHAKEHEHEDGTKHSHSHEQEHEHADGTKHSHDDSAHSHKHQDGTEHSHSHKAEHQHSDGTTHTHSEETENKQQDHQHKELTQLRTDSEGKIKISLSSEGIWYLRTIYLTHSEEAGLTHESNWATLTFAVGQAADGHSHDKADHDHTEEHSHEIPGWAYWVGSLILIAGLFFWFNRKNT